MKIIAQNIKGYNLNNLAFKPGIARNNYKEAHPGKWVEMKKFHAPQNQNNSNVNF